MYVFEKLADSYNSHSFLQQEVLSRMLDRLSFIKILPSNILDLGYGTGNSFKLLQALYPNSNIIGIDTSHKMLKKSENKNIICADIENLPIQEDSIDLVFSNLSLHWVNLEKTLKTIKNILKHDCPVMLSLFGPASLYEYLEILDKNTGYFFDMHDIGDSIHSLKWSNAVIEREDIFVDYKEIKKLNEDLYHTGLLDFLKINEETIKNVQFKDPLKVTYEIIYIFAWNKKFKKIKTKILTENC